MVVPLDEDLNVTNEDFTLELMHCINQGFYPVDDGGNLAIQDQFRALWLVGSAAEVNLSNPEVGRSWSFRCYNVRNDRSTSDQYTPEQGYKFEWWEEDGTAHSLDFILGPEGVTGKFYGQRFAHVIVMRSLRRKSITIIHDGQRIEKFHPSLGEPWYNPLEKQLPRMSIGVDCQLGSDLGADYAGYISSARLTKGKCLYGFQALPLDRDLRVSAN